jgi:GDP-4-dehydro-6-deoxy-D-mannose reductase
MRALVFGAEGFVGGHLVRHLVAEGDEVVCGVHAKRHQGPERTVTVDITDQGAVSAAVSDIQPDVVYHLAGISFVPEAEGDFERVLRINVAGPANVARACGELKRDVAVIFVSSAEVYGAVPPDQLPVTEACLVKPMHNYSLSKRMGELVMERFARTASIRCAIARPFNHIGPGQDKRFVTASFAYQLAQIAHGKAEPRLKVGNLEALRDFSDVRDIVRGYRLLAHTKGGTYNLGSGRAIAVRQLLDMLISIAGVEVVVEQDHARMRPSEVSEVYGSFEAIKRECGWFPIIPIERSLADVYQYWFEQVGTGCV